MRTMCAARPREALNVLDAPFAGQLDIQAAARLRPASLQVGRRERALTTTFATASPPSAPSILDNREPAERAPGQINEARVVRLCCHRVVGSNLVIVGLPTLMAGPE